MAKKHVLKGENFVRWEIDTTDEVWVLDKNATIMAPLDGIKVTPIAAGSEIFVNGDITANTMGYGGISIFAGNVDVTIGKSSLIDANLATYGVYSNTLDGDIFNYGTIRSQMVGVQNIGVMDVHNTGKITASQGIFALNGGGFFENDGLIKGSSDAIYGGAEGTEIKNAAGGRIIGANGAIRFSDDGDAEIVNRGLIKGGDDAVTDLGGNLKLTNRGAIVGDVVLGGGDDSFDTRGGTLDGYAIGGAGNDIYKVSSQVDILELLGDGFDVLFSSASFTLASDIEILKLTGRKNIDGTGSGVGNELLGNSGRNVLLGLGGDDRLAGGGGRDILTGGDGADLFDFHSDFYSDFGKDRITDFEDGVDRLLIDGVTSQQELDALNIEQSGADIVISMSGGRQIVIENMLVSDLTYVDDFAPLV